MAWGEAAAEQHEQDQPSTFLRPDGASPELPPLADRKDFGERITVVLAVIRFHSDAQLNTVAGGKTSYHAERQRAAEAKADQLVLMRAKQIMDEAEERRQNVMRKLAKPPHACEAWQMQESAKGGLYCAACGVPEVPSV